LGIFGVSHSKVIFKDCFETEKAQQRLVAASFEDRKALFWRGSHFEIVGKDIPGPIHLLFIPQHTNR
jgi:hypothetical protein